MLTFFPKPPAERQFMILGINSFSRYIYDPGPRSAVGRASDSRDRDVGFDTVMYNICYKYHYLHVFATF